MSACDKSASALVIPVRTRAIPTAGAAANLNVWIVTGSLSAFSTSAPRLLRPPVPADRLRSGKFVRPAETRDGNRFSRTLGPQTFRTSPTAELVAKSDGRACRLIPWKVIEIEIKYGEIVPSRCARQFVLHPSAKTPAIGSPVRISNGPTHGF